MTEDQRIRISFHNDVTQLFPLPLAPFEQYMVADDRPGYPMNCVFTMEFDGEFERGAFESSLDEAILRHPLMIALLNGSKRRPFWTLEGASKPCVDFGAKGAPIQSDDEQPIDITKNAGMQIWVRQGGGHAVVTLQFHHACSDGVGAMQFLGDLLAAYAVRMEPDANVAWTALDPATLRGRTEFDFEYPEPLSFWMAARYAIPETVKWLVRRPAPLRTQGNKQLPNEFHSFPNLFSHTLTGTETKALRSVANGSAGTLNDLLIHDLFKTIAHWNGGSSRDNRWLRISMPVNLRGEKDRHMPAANMVSHAFLSRRTRQVFGSNVLLEDIQQETKVIKDWNIGTRFVHALSTIAKVPGLLPMTVRSRRCFATAVLSNLGDPVWHFHQSLPSVGGQVKAGNVVLTRILGVPPVRPKTSAVFMVTCYAGELTVCTRCDPKCFTTADAKQLLTLYINRLRKSAGIETAG